MMRPIHAISSLPVLNRGSRTLKAALLDAPPGVS
jgi:hypothetical protein